jgi:hypothetical protein
MGDRGGKKDKQKHQQQHVKKQKDKEREKTDNARPQTPVAKARPEGAGVAR